MIIKARSQARPIPMRNRVPLLLCVAAAYGAAHPASAQVDTIPPGREVTIPGESILRVSEDGVVTVARNGAQPRAQRSDRGVWGTVGRITNQEELRRAARSLARQGGEVEEVADRLRRLLRQPGSALYLEINRERPFDVVLRPVPNSRLYIGIEPNERASTGEFRGGSLSARTDRSDAKEVYAWFINGTRQPEYVIEVPPIITHVTLVVNGETIAAARPVDPSEGAVTYHAR